MTTEIEANAGPPSEAELEAFRFGGAPFRSPIASAVSNQDNVHDCSPAQAELKRLELP